MKSKYYYIVDTVNKNDNTHKSFSINNDKYFFESCEEFKLIKHLQQMDINNNSRIIRIDSDISSADTFELHESQATTLESLCLSLYDFQVKSIFFVS